MKVKGYKIFNADWTCRDFKFEVGKTYKHDGEAKLCESGFHFCENPIDCFFYYPPTGKLAEVEADATDETHPKDSKRVAGEIKIVGEISLSAAVQAGVKFILSKVNFKDAPATNTGDFSAATNTGYQSAATNTGDRSAATVEGKESIAIAAGFESKASGSLGCWIVLTERDDNYCIVSVKAFKVDGKRILSGQFYTLKNGKAIKA